MSDQEKAIKHLKEIGSNKLANAMTKNLTHQIFAK